MWDASPAVATYASETHTKILCIYVSTKTMTKKWYNMFMSGHIVPPKKLHDAQIFFGHIPHNGHIAPKKGHNMTSSCHGAYTH